MLEIAPGTSLGAYVITARIGRGGMATVYQAHHPALDRDVAIKVLWRSLAETPGFLERFRREARAASRLRHPNILTVYDFGEADGIAFMVTELLPGGTLADRLGHPLPFTEVLRVVRGIGAALDVAHHAGLIHRDVKPSNILFTRDGEPVLADFGIARLVEAEEQLTVQGTLIGTPHYMAPEMASGEEAGPSSDLYSLGVVLYEMLAGEPPFPRPTPLATVRAHVHESPPSLAQRDPTISAAISAVVAHALAKHPADRFRSGLALAAAFEEAVLSGEPPTPRPGSVAPIFTRPTDPDATFEIPRGAVPPTHRLPRTDAPGDYGAVIPGPPNASWGDPASNTERWPRPATAPRRRRYSPLGLLVIVVMALLVTAGAFLARSTGLGVDFGFGPSQTATRTPTSGGVVTQTPAPGGPAFGTSPTAGLSPVPGQSVPSPPPIVTPASPVAIVESPVAEASPDAVTPATATVPTTATPSTTPTVAPPTPTVDPRRGPLNVQFTTPNDGASVPARPPVAGRRTGLQGPDEHLWMLIHPDGGPDNWWPYKRELIADRDGAWRLDDVEIGGPPGSRHVLAVGVVDAATHQQILNQIRDRQDEPFVGGQPPGFQELTRVTVVKR
jgi:serine/threonine protein kinase